MIKFYTTLRAVMEKGSWAAIIEKVAGGYLAFRSKAEYYAWKYKA